MKAADTSPVIAAFASWHERHEAARRALDAGLRLNTQAYTDFILGLHDRGVTGGAAYDALVAATAASCGAELVTCDRRALPVYERYGIRTRLLP